MALLLPLVWIFQRHLKLDAIDDEDKRT
uniref:Uncharacterized protein n=1 Tax=Oryza sativa subsp. japonica TaxID=39947 RepID=Q109F3_ORYSJ|nr:hypothetical protein LOC_Os10g36839 [Oryza sativa Japonica Group]